MSETIFTKFDKFIAGKIIGNICMKRRNIIFSFCGIEYIREYNLNIISIASPNISSIIEILRDTYFIYTVDYCKYVVAYIQYDIDTTKKCNKDRQYNGIENDDFVDTKKYCIIKFIPSFIDLSERIDRRKKILKLIHMFIDGYNYHNKRVYIYLSYLKYPKIYSMYSSENYFIIDGFSMNINNKSNLFVQENNSFIFCNLCKKEICENNYWCSSIYCNIFICKKCFEIYPITCCYFYVSAGKTDDKKKIENIEKSKIDIQMPLASVLMKPKTDKTEEQIVLKLSNLSKKYEKYISKCDQPQKNQQQKDQRGHKNMKQKKTDPISKKDISQTIQQLEKKYIRKSKSKRNKDAKGKRNGDTGDISIDETKNQLNRDIFGISIEESKVRQHNSENVKQIELLDIYHKDNTEDGHIYLEIVDNILNEIL